MEVYYWFWGLLTTTALVWYCTITVFISFRGAADIRTMLDKLKRGAFDPDAPDS